MLITMATRAYASFRYRCCCHRNWMCSTTLMILAMGCLWQQVRGFIYIILNPADLRFISCGDKPPSFSSIEKNTEWEAWRSCLTFYLTFAKLSQPNQTYHWKLVLLLRNLWVDWLLHQLTKLECICLYFSKDRLTTFNQHAQHIKTAVYQTDHKWGQAMVSAPVYIYIYI